jgi:hypothetical protein
LKRLKKSKKEEMTYKIYIQSLNNFPIADWAVSAYLGWKELGTDIIFFEDIEEVPASKWHIVVADIESTNAYFKRLGLPPKMSLNIPKSIEKYAGRQIIRTTMGEYKKTYNVPYMYPIFMKPDGLSKEFIGGVLESEESFKLHMADKPDETPILLSEVVKFVSEYRGYVCEGKLLGIYFYMGDFRVFPDMTVIDSAIAEYEDAPAGYSIDFGITDDGRTLLIECNDGWSLGNYGLEPSKYCRLLGRRWHELMKAF